MSTGIPLEQVVSADSLCYQVFGLRLESDCALPELPPDGGAGPAISVKALTPYEGLCAPVIWFREWYARDGGLQLRAGSNGEGLILRFTDNAEFLVSPDCLKIRYCREYQSLGAGFRHALLDQVVPRTLAQRGHLVLHASSVLTTAGAACFIGHPGHGKSTLAAAFHSGGARLLADDALLINAGPAGVYCTPSYPGVRLWPDVAERFGPAVPAWRPVGYRPKKLRCCLDQGPGAPPIPGKSPVRAILSLRRQPPAVPPVRTTLERLSAAAATAELMVHAFKFDIGDRDHLSQLLRQAALVAATVPVYLATYSSDLDGLPRVCAQIVREIERGSA